jgi:iron complex outermembrane recepter protein
MMKKLSLAICYIFLYVNVSAQSTLSGSVIDVTSGEPVAGATIEIDQASSVIADQMGKFSIPASKRPQLLTVTSIGYRTVQVSAEKGKDLTIRLERYKLFLQPVEIKATRAGVKSPFSKTNIDRQEIEKANLGQDLPFLLNQTPSVVINSDAGNGIGYTGIKIRGTDATRINMTLNGIPYNDAESQGIFFVNLPDFSSSVNSIQIQRGVGTSSNGAGAFGATLNLSTNDFNEKPYADITNSAGSFNTWRHTVKAGTGLINDHFTLDARLSKISSDGFIDRGSSALSSFYISGAYYTPSSSVRLNIFSGKEKTYQAWNGIPQYKLHYNRDSLIQHYSNNLGSLYFTAADSVNLFSANPRTYNVFTYPNQTDNYQQDHYQLFFNHNVSRVSLNSAVYLTRGRGYYEEFKYNARLSAYGLPDFVTGGQPVSRTDLVRQLWLDNTLYGGIFSLLYTSSSGEGTFGGGVNRYDGDHKGFVTWAEAGVPNNYPWYRFPAVKTDFNVYAKWQQRFTEGLDVFADIQYRNVHYVIDGSRKFPELRINDRFHFFNPKAGLTYTRGTITAYASYAIANKEPNRNDYETGSVQAKPKAETLKDLEFGIQQAKANFNWSTGFYFMNYKDQLMLSGKINDVGDALRFNVPSSYRMGMELQAGYRPSTKLIVSGNVSLSRNKIRDFYDNIPRYDVNFDLVQQDTIYYKETNMAFSPNVVAAGNIRYLPVKHAEIALMSKYVGDQFLDNTSKQNRKLEGYFVQDLRLSYSILQWMAKEINLTLQVNNLLNKRYESNGYTYSYMYDKATVTENFYYPMAGRNFLASVNVKF